MVMFFKCQYNDVIDHLGDIVLQLHCDLTAQVCVCSGISVKGRSQQSPRQPEQGYQLVNVCQCHTHTGASLFVI